MDCFLKSLRIKVNNAVEVIMNSPVMRKKESEFPKNDNIIQLDTPQSDKIKTSNVFDETDEKSTDDNKSTENSETVSDSESSEDKEQSESDSVFDSASTFHNYYHPGMTQTKNISPIDQEILFKKISRQISDPGKDSSFSLFSIMKSSVKEKETWTDSPESKSENDYSKFFYVSPRRDSLFDTIQLKSSMNHHLKYGDRKERLTYTVSKNVTNIEISDKELVTNTIQDNEKINAIIKAKDISKLGDIGFQVVDEDGEESLLEIDITDIEAVKEEKNLTQTRRQSISDRLNKRRTSEIMAEILRLSAENRRKEFKTLLNDHNKLVKSIDKGLYRYNMDGTKRELFTVDSLEGSSEECATDSSNGIWDQNSRTVAQSENEEDDFLNFNSDGENSSVLPK